MFVAYYRPAVGICAFPDGGFPIYGYRGAELFEYDVVERSLHHLGSQDAGRRFQLGRASGAVEIRYRSGRTLYGIAFGSDGGRYYEIDTEEGALNELSREEFSRLTSGLERTHGIFVAGDREQNENETDWWGATREYFGRLSTESRIAERGGNISHTLVLHTSGYPSVERERLELPIDFTDLLPDRF